MKQICAALILIVTAALPAAANCLSQSEARQVVASGQARSLGSVAGSLGGEIVRAQLCRQGGGYVYVISVLRNGQVSNVTVNANR